MTAAARLYRIERLIRQRGCVSMATLLAELEVSRATLKRDLDVLRDQLGAPIDYDRAANGYRLRPSPRGQESHELPGLWFSERELYALLMVQQLLAELDEDGVLTRHLQPLLARIQELLHSHDADPQALQALLSRVKVLAASRRPVPGAVFERVAEALMRRQRLRTVYFSRSRGQASERELSPQRLVHHRATWYLDAWCHTRKRLLRFALDAMQQVQVLEAAARDVPVSTVQAEMDAGYGIFAGAATAAHWATLRFTRQAAAWVQHEQWHPEQRGALLADGSFELSLPYVDSQELAGEVLRHAGEVQIVADDGPLRATVAERLQRAVGLLAP